MMMVELTTAPSAAIPVDALAEHLRLSSGFADDGSQNAILERCLRSAMAAIEARTGKVLIARRFALTFDGWHGPEGHGLPVAPVSAVDSVKLVNRTGAETLVDDTRYSLRSDNHRPAIVGSLPDPVTGGFVEVELTAGYGPDWTSVPHDLQHAWTALAAEFYERDTPVGTIPLHVQALIAPYRPMRLGRGAV